MSRQNMGRTIAAVAVVVAIGVSACGSDGVPQAEHDLVLSELTLANEELALAQEELAETTRRLDSAAEAQDEAERRARELEQELEELFTIDASEDEVMRRQQSLGVLGNLFVEFRGGDWTEETVAMFAEFIDETGDESLIEQLDAFAAAVAADPDSEEADYEYGVLGYEIMAALEREVVDPFGR